MLEEGQIKILMRMHELEQSLAELYALFAEKFPAHRELFLALVKEEHEHAEAVQKLYRLTYSNDAAFSEGSTRLAAIESILEYVKKNDEIARRDNMTAEHALELSRDIEKSMIAKNIFQHFKVRLEFSNLLRYLRDSSEEHAKMVQAEIDRSRKKRSV
jgi:rubrerythrin